LRRCDDKRKGGEEDKREMDKGIKGKGKNQKAKIETKRESLAPLHGNRA
jgi:hypothetical protein